MWAFPCLLLVAEGTSVCARRRQAYLSPPCPAETLRAVPRLRGYPRHRHHGLRRLHALLRAGEPPEAGHPHRRPGSMPRPPAGHQSPWVRAFLRPGAISAMQLPGGLLASTWGWLIACFLPCPAALRLMPLMPGPLIPDPWRLGSCHPSSVTLTWHSLQSQHVEYSRKQLDLRGGGGGVGPAPEAPYRGSEGAAAQGQTPRPGELSPGQGQGACCQACQVPPRLPALCRPCSPCGCHSGTAPLRVGPAPHHTASRPSTLGWELGRRGLWRTLALPRPSRPQAGLLGDTGQACWRRGPSGDSARALILRQP